MDIWNAPSDRDWYEYVGTQCEEREPEEDESVRTPAEAIEQLRALLEEATNYGSLSASDVRQEVAALQFLRLHASNLLDVAEAVNICKNLEHALYCEGCAYDHLTERWRILSSQLNEAHKSEDAALRKLVEAV